MFSVHALTNCTAGMFLKISIAFGQHFVVVFIANKDNSGFSSIVPESDGVVVMMMMAAMSDGDYGHCRQGDVLLRTL